MALIDLLLNIAGMLLWLSWRSVRFDPLAKAVPASLIGTLRPAEPRHFKGWQFLFGLAALLCLRGLLYWQLCPAAEWTPKIDAVVVVLPFRSDSSHLFGLQTAFLFSVLSFARVFIIVYFWLVATAVINRRTEEPDPLLRLIRLHLGRLSRWPWFVHLAILVSLLTAIWLILHPWLAHIGTINRAQSQAHLVEQGALIGLGVFFALLCSLKYLIAIALFLHFIISYVFLGAHPLWEFVSGTAGNLLAPLQQVPLRFGKLDLAPLVGIILTFLALHVLPNLVQTKMAQHGWARWPL